MGRRRRQWKAEEARSIRKRRVLQWGAFLLLGATLTGLGFFLWPPIPEEERLIRLAAERGWFVFGVHFGAQDFAQIQAHMEEALRTAREQGQRVVLVEELGSIGVPRDKATGKIPSASRWLELIAKDPVRAKAWFYKTMAGWKSGGDRLKRGEYCVPAYYTDNPAGSFTKALHDLLIRERDLLEDVVEEDLGWEDYLQGVEMDDLEERSLQAYREGRPDETEKLLRERELLSRANKAGRDRRLLLQMGRIMDGRKDLVAITVRGVGHWGIVEGYGLKYARRTDWKRALEVSFGVHTLELLRLMGTPATPKEEARAILAYVPTGLLMEELLHLEPSGGVHEAVKRANRIMENPLLTHERLRKLSFALGQAHAATNVEAGALAKDWLRREGFLKEGPP